MILYDQSYISRAVVSDDKNNEYNLKIINMFDGVNNIDKTIYQNAQQEVKVMKTFNHKNVLKVVDYFEIGYYFLIVTERYESSLEQWLRSRQTNQLFLPQIISFSDQLFQALEHIHSKKKEARDIDLSTIMIDKNNQLKVVCNGYFNANIFRRVQSLQIQNQKNKISLLYNVNQQISENEIDMTQNILKVDKTKLKQIDVLASIQVIYQLGGANLVDRFNRELLVDNLDEQLISTFLTIFESKNQNPPLLKDILKSIKKVKSDIWDGCQFAKKLFKSAQNMKEKPQAAIDLLLLCIEQHPKDPQYYQAVGDFYKSIQKYDDSAQAYKKCLQEGKENQICQDSLLEVYQFKSTQEQLQKDKLIEVCIEKGNPFINLCHEFTYNSKEVKKSRISFKLIVILIVIFKDVILVIMANLLAFISAHASIQACSQQIEACYAQVHDDLQGFYIAQYHFFKGCLDSEKVGYICSTGVADSILKMYLNDCVSIIFYSKQPLYDSRIYIQQCFHKTSKSQGFCYVHLANYYQHQFKYNEAIQIMDKCLKSLPNNAYCLMYLGLFYQLDTTLQDYNKSINYYQLCYDLYQLESCRDEILKVKQQLNQPQKVKQELNQSQKVKLS
ncbi:kinase domain protein (macronuclear) [Tetrahymena thermophila SB210]|uniref:Kinase domain protein n=1 Tax=Tetrahymena thermophila (strain SB210) TaxID=312017 RepID=W7X8Q5_TETTS|nr:kinase domain protein [Tetrahymena thermophila SB210]EWS73737.1 kinase domain protein [Tetrahymena thermophila SB210]|eukprot:XP_012653775.1 kinase domain protein [Tetrahymena thermophila SB210]